MFEELVKNLIKKNITICSIESFTGGYFSNSITDIPGASKVFNFGLITYNNKIKSSVLDIDINTINTHSAISSQISKLMSQKIIKRYKTDYSISFTGNAGPDIIDNIKVGECYISISSKLDTKTYHKNFSGNRYQIKKVASEFAAKELLKIINN